MKNPKAVILSVAMAVVGIGLMGMSTYGGQMKAIGGFFFLVGVTLTAIFLYHELKK